MVRCAGVNGAPIAILASTINQSLTLYGQTKQVTQVSAICNFSNAAKLLACTSADLITE